MLNQIYDWKRFWCPRTGRIDLSDGGYLSNPDVKFGKAYNPDLLALEEISAIQCLILLGEPGIGKSQELNNLKALTDEQISDTDQILELNLRSCTSLKDDLFKNETFLEWLESDYQLYLFLDSLDEGLLSIPTLATGLVDELQKKKYQDHLHRLNIRIACRTFVFPEILEEGLKEFWSNNQIGIYELVPLRRVDVMSAASTEGFLPENFLEEIAQKDIVPLAIKPVTLGFLLNTYRKHNGQFPADQKLHDFYLEGCKLLCEEVSLSRRASNQTGELDSDQRLIVAARIAAVTIFANRFAVWTGIDQGEVPTENVHHQKLCFGYEKVNGREFELTREAVREVLDTGLFSSRGAYRMGWAHQTYSEFLAAWYLTQHNLSLSQIQSLILGSDGKVVPQLQETAAWLASMRSDVFRAILETDANILLQSDIASASEEDRASLITNLLELYDQEKIPYTYFNILLYEKLKHSTLSGQLEHYITSSNRSIDARNTAIDIANACQLTELSISLADIALDPQEPEQVRLNAAIAVCGTGNETAKKKLKALALLESKNNFEDELKGCGLRAVWPKHLTIQEAFGTLSSPKSSVIGGRYQDFVAFELGQDLHFENLLFALRWLSKQPLDEYIEYPFSHLHNSILSTAWEYIENAEVLNYFSKITIRKLRSRLQLVEDSGAGDDLIQKIENDDGKRHLLLKGIVDEAAKRDTDTIYVYYITNAYQDILFEKDFCWLIEQLKEAKSKSSQQIWAKLIRAKYIEDDFEHVNAILVESEKNSVFREVFANRLDSVDLDSDRAKEEKELCEQQNSRRREEAALETSPETKVLDALTKFEFGQILEWVTLCHDVTLKSSNAHHNKSELRQPDLTRFPAWKEASESTKKRLIEAAKTYLVHGDPKSEQWLGTNYCPCDSALAGYKALQLLQQVGSSFISKLSVEVWQKWIPIILAYPSPRDEEHIQYRHELCRLAYQNASSEFLRILLLLIDQQNRDCGTIRITSYIKSCWDENLYSTLLEKVKDESLSANSVKSLLEELLKHNGQEAQAFAESLVISGASVTGQDREKAIFAARLLMLHTEDASWSIVWPAIQSNPQFGQEVLESVSSMGQYGDHINQNLNESSLADLYIFLERQYPNDNDEDDNKKQNSSEDNLVGVGAGFMGPRDVVRRWKDDIPQRLQERGTQEACAALQRIIDELPDLKDKLQWRLLETEVSTRRRNWQPLKPKEILDLVTNQEPSNSDLSNQIDVIDKSIKKMEDEPKVQNNNISISDSSVYAPIGTSGETNSNVTIASSDASKGINLGNWLAAIGILIAIIAIPTGMLVSGAFNEEFREWWNHNFSSEVEQQPTPKDQ